MKARLYLETSVVSYLSARRSRDPISAAHQQITVEWWRRRHLDFDIFTSEVVVAEARLGDPVAARLRLDTLHGIPLLEVTEPARSLAEAIIQSTVLPREAFPDALHIAIATTHELDYLLTWNCAHIANAEILPRIALLCDDLGFALPYICTPEELIGDTYAH